MKKVAATAGIIFVMIIGGIFLISGKEMNTEVTKDTTKVGFILNGSCLDKSWGQSHYEGMEQSARDLNLKVLYRENVPEDETCIPVIEELIAEKCKIIICNSFGYGEWELQVAKAHPEVYFFHATGVEETTNMATYFGRIYQMRYLSGIVAGLQTKTNKIGYVAAMPISEVNRGINAFTLGVRLVNKDANVYVKWTNSWLGEEESEKVTLELLEEQDIDVLTVHVDTSCPLEIAEERGIWIIGYNMDNSEIYPNTFLTAPVWDWAKFYEPRILECLQGKFKGRHYWEGANTGIVTLAPFTEHVVEGAQEIVEQEFEKLKNGTYDVFYGPIKDQNGNIRVESGTSMSDEAMLNEFDWYVEGVITNESE